MKRGYPFEDYEKIKSSVLLLDYIEQNVLTDDETERVIEHLSLKLK